MNLQDLLDRLTKHNIPMDAKITSDSGWECSASDVGGAYYNKSLNTVVLVQDINRNSNYYRSKSWSVL